jgi:hypothetical protein
MVFTKDQAIKALSAATEALRTADVTGVWLDMSGSGWTEDYKIIIDTNQKHGRDVVIQRGPGVGQTVWLADLPPLAKTAVSTALAGLEIGDRLMLNYEPRERYAGGEKVWPIRHLIADLRHRIVELEDEIARLTQLTGK